MDGGKTVTEHKEIAKILNQYYNTAVNSDNKSLLTETENLEDPLEIAIEKFENYPSILSMKETINMNELF